MSEGAFEQSARWHLEEIREHAKGVRTTNDAAMLIVLALEGVVSGRFVHVSAGLSGDLLTIDVLLRCAPHHARVTQPITGCPQAVRRAG